MSVYIFLGTAGTGKGTQAKLLCDGKSKKHVSTGDLLRDAVKSQSELGLEVQSILESGQLVSDSIVNKLVSEFLSLHKDASIILDGYPRTYEQALSLNDILSNSFLTISNVFYFHLSKAEAVKRIVGRRLCTVTGRIFHETLNPPPIDYPHSLKQRSDDSESNAVARYQVFMEQTKPLLDYYKNNLVEIDASHSIEVVYNSLKSKIR